MPYHWTTPPQAPRAELQLWPHNALSPKGFAVMVLGFFLAASIPLYGVLGTAVLWGLLPFMLGATAALYYALRRNRRDREILEVLTLDDTQIALHRRNPDGSTQEWQCNTHWASVHLHDTGGPLPYYVTLKGAGREVEIGAFLSEDERKTLYDELATALIRAKEV